MTLPEWLVQQKKLLEAATQGPWFTGGENVLVSLDMPGLPEDSNGVIVECCDDPFKPNGWSEQRQKNADFISNVRTEHARALKLIEKYREALEKAENSNSEAINGLVRKFIGNAEEDIRASQVIIRSALAYFPDDSEVGK